MHSNGKISFSVRCQLLDDYPSEPFTEVYRMKFAAIDSARIAKKKLDNRSFYGKDLHVCYAPEFESVQDTREKLEQRRRVIAWKTRGKGRGSVFSPGCLRIVGHYP